MRHAVGKWYASMTAVDRADKTFVWEATFLWTLQGFRAAVLRRCYNIKKHYANREHTNLIAIVSDKERAKYLTLVSIQREGSHMLTSVFERAIDDAERAHNSNIRAQHYSRGCGRFVLPYKCPSEPLHSV